MKELRENENLEFIVQSSPIRAFTDDDYRKVGGQVSQSLKDSNVIFAIKEIPLPLLEPEKTYLFFSHTIKGQKDNMPMLKRILDLKATLNEETPSHVIGAFVLIKKGMYSDVQMIAEGLRVKIVKDILFIKQNF